MEAALYSNCLLLGLDASVLGPGGLPRSGLFRHSNPRMGEALLHFLLCALRGPTQSTKDFSGVWPIFDAAQSRDFRKIVQNLISELEAQGALPRSNSRVSSLATCCGQRFVELLWQLSAHTLREVHKRSFPADVALNPLPASLTEVVVHNTHASALLAVTKARIGIERRRFLEGAAEAVRRQALWSNLAHDMTADYRELCAEEAYLLQELGKLKESEAAKDRLGLKGDQKSISVTRVSHLWESLLSFTEDHKKLASGPIEDLIAHREHRYRISGTALRATIDKSSSTVSSELSGFVSEEFFDRYKNDENSLRQVNLGYLQDFSKRKIDACVYEITGSGEIGNNVDDRAGKRSTPLDVVEIIRRWTHSLQRIHKHALLLARYNDGAGPELMEESSIQGDHGHSQALKATLAEHRQHLANIQVFIRQLKDAGPVMEASIAALHEQVSRTNPLPAMAPVASSFTLSDTQQISKEVNVNHATEGGFKSMLPKLELLPPSPALKLPQIFFLSPVTMGKLSLRHCPSVPRMRSLVVSQGREISDNQATSQNMLLKETKENTEECFASLRQAVHDATLFGAGTIAEVQPERLAKVSEHFFMPAVSSTKSSQNESEIIKQNLSSNIKEVKFPQEYQSLMGKSPLKDARRFGGFYCNSQSEGLTDKYDDPGSMLSESPSNGVLSYQYTAKSDGDKLELNSSTEAIEVELVRPFSPPLLTELSTFGETYDDLLAPMSEVDVALMDCTMQTLHA